MQTPPRPQASQHTAVAAAPPPSSAAYYMAAPKSGPVYKTWTDEEGALDKQSSYTCCTKFKFAIWLSIVVLLVAAAVGLSVTMAIVQDNREKNRPPRPPPPPSPPSDVDPEGGHGGGSGGGGNEGPLPVPDATPPFQVPTGYQAIWWDEFDGSSLDENKWGFDIGNGDWGWGNNEVQYYTDNRENVRLEGGKLLITALRDGDRFTSARINTKQTASFYPGMKLKDGTSFTSIHVEARIQVPSPGQGLWPAFWMFPTGLEYGKWAASGEIDILESINEMTTLTQGLHFGGEDPQNVKNMVKTRQKDKSPYSDDFHTVAVDWSLDKIVMYVDGEAVKTYLPREKDPEGGWWTSAEGAGPDAPFDQPFYLILNLAVGGLWPKPPDATTPSSSTLTVDYVRVWGAPL